MDVIQVSYLGQVGADAEDAVLVDLCLPEGVAVAARAPGDPPPRRLRQHHGRRELPRHDQVGVPVRPDCCNCVVVEGDIPYEKLKIVPTLPL